MTTHDTFRDQNDYLLIFGDSKNCFLALSSFLDVKQLFTLMIYYLNSKLELTQIFENKNRKYFHKINRP